MLPRRSSIKAVRVEPWVLGGKSGSEPGPRPGRARAGRPRSLQSEEAILAAAGKLLSSEGYVGLTVSKVAARGREPANPPSIDAGRPKSIW